MLRSSLLSRLHLRRLGLLLCFAAVLGVPLSCGPEVEDPPAESSSAGAPTSKPETIVLVSIDTLRADRLPAWGYEGVSTPALDALAAESVRYARAWSHVPLTLPSHASVMTGLLPAEHGVRDNAGYALDGSVPTLAETLAAAGWATCAAVSAAPLQARTGIAAGFDSWDDRLEGTVGDGLGEVQRKGPDTVAAVLHCVRAAVADDRPLFLFVHLFEPHTPYDPPADLAARWGKTYDAEVAAADRAFASLRAELDSLGLWDEAAVVLFSDHGEGLGDHGEDEHGVLLYREALHVPLLVKLPHGVHGGTVVAESAQLVDLHPTVLALAGLDLPVDRASISSGGARSLLDEDLRPADLPADRTILSETYYPRIHFGWSELLSVVRGDDHFLRAASTAGPVEELYDLATDFGERDDLRPRDRRRAAEHGQALDAALATFDRPWSAPSALDEEQRAHLAALGYVSSSAAETRDGPRADPKTKLPIYEALRRGAAALRAQDYADAVRRLEPVLAEEPDLVDGWTVLGHALLNLGRRDDALRAYLRVLELAGPRPEVAAPAATILADDGEIAAALDLLRSQIDLATSRAAPDSVRLRALEARLLLRSDRPDDAAARLGEWIDRHPEDADAWYQRGVAHLLAGDPAASERDLRRAVALAPDAVPALHDLGVLLERTGRDAEAEAFYARVLELDPEHPLARRRPASG